MSGVGRERGNPRRDQAVDIHLDRPTKLNAELADSVFGRSGLPYLRLCSVKVMVLRCGKITATVVAVLGSKVDARDTSRVIESHDHEVSVAH